MQSLRILLVASEGPPVRSGVARTIEYLTDGLRQRGHIVDVLAYPQLRRLVLGEVRLTDMALWLWREGRRLEDYDVINLHGVAPTVSDFFLLFARLRRLHVPLIYSHLCEIAVGPAWLHSLYNKFHAKLCDYATEVLSPSEAYATSFTHGNASVIPLGADVQRFSGTERKDEEFTALFVGQFRSYKGVQFLIKAAAQVQGMRLLIAGHGPQETEYRKLAEQLSVDVEFYVNVGDDELRELYRRAHVVVLPSVTRAEAFGMVLIEGMAAGCVPVASALPGVMEVIGRIGVLVPAGSTNALAKTLRFLRNNPEIVQNIGSRARERASSFAASRTIDDYERLFLGLVATRELRNELETQITVGETPMRRFAAKIATIVQSAQAHVFLRKPGEDLHHVTSVGIGPFPYLVPSFLQRVANYTLAAGEPVLVAPGSIPRDLADLSTYEGSLIAAPISAKRGRFGSLLAVRAEAFDERDLDALERFARHAGATLDPWPGAIDNLAAAARHAAQL